MANANLDLIRNVYAAFARGDGPAALSSMDSTIVWNEAENFPYADRNPYVGPVAVAEGVFFRLATEWDDFQAVPAEFFDAGDTVIVTGRYPATYKARRRALTHSSLTCGAFVAARSLVSSNTPIPHRLKARF